MVAVSSSNRLGTLSQIFARISNPVVDKLTAHSIFPTRDPMATKAYDVLTFGTSHPYVL